RKTAGKRFMPNHAGVLQSRFFPAKLEAEGDDAIFNTLLDTAADSVRRKVAPVPRSNTKPSSASS
ncbi:hypothetical protein MXC99_04175, partial [Thauera aromatica]|nr:hypothetical protein [Thauera aromatica]